MRSDQTPRPRSGAAAAALLLLSTTLLAQDAGRLKADAPIVCSACDGWNAPHQPFKVFGNTYYVGVAGLSSILITSDAGHILLDGGLPQSAPLIEANIRALGFRLQDVKLIAGSHEHYDHAGGINALQRASGAAVAVSPLAAKALAQGEPAADDPQYGFGRRVNQFPAVSQVRSVRDGEALRVGSLEVVAHFTPGHTPGSTTWSWRSCESARCLDVVYADSLNAISAPGFKFTAVNGRAERFRQSIDTVRRLPCDILLSVHPEFSNLDKKLTARRDGAADAFIDSSACRAYADAALNTFERRLGEEALRAK